VWWFWVVIGYCVFGEIKTWESVIASPNDVDTDKVSTSSHLAGINNRTGEGYPTENSTDSVPPTNTWISKDYSNQTKRTADSGLSTNTSISTDYSHHSSEEIGSTSLTNVNSDSVSSTISKLAFNHITSKEHQNAQTYTSTDYSRKFSSTGTVTMEDGENETSTTDYNNILSTTKISSTNSRILSSQNFSRVNDELTSASSTFSFEASSNDIVPSEANEVAKPTNESWSATADESSTEMIPEGKNAYSENDIPTVNFKNINASSFDVTLEWESPENNECVDEYIIYLDNEEKQRLTDTFTTNITDLHACQKYTVGIAVFYAGTEGTKTEKTFDTPVPESFVNYSVKNLRNEAIQEKILNVTWEAPDMVEQCVTSYYLIWWDEQNNQDTTDKTVDAPNTYLEITPIIGCMRYVIQIYPQADVSAPGKLDVTYYKANEFPTNPPEIVMKSNSQTSVNVTWKIDDKSKNKCPLSWIAVTCNAPDYNNSNAPWIITDPPSVALNISSPTASFRFPMTIEDLSPFTNYTCFALVTNSAGNSSTTRFEFTTDQDVPSEPQSLQIINVGSNNFTIQWSEPVKIPGIMVNYQLFVNNSGPMHTPGAECLNTTSYNFTVDAQDTSYFFDKALPYYKYTVSLYAVDEAGEGNSTSNETITQSTEPEPVQNVQAEPPIYSENEIYSATVTVKFDPPCNTNGPFKRYEISFSGERDGFETDEGIVPIQDTTSEIKLQAERNYSISVRVVTDDFTSTSVKVPEIRTNAGVPILSGNLTAPTIHDTTKAQFKLQKSAFDNTNGEIISFALFVVTKQSNNADKSYGFWNGTDATWPSAPGEAVQLTPNLWNPFENGSDTVDFLIGNDTECSNANYCNRALSEDTEYYLIVRGLTSAAFKDSGLLHFKTDMPDELQNLGLILGLTFGLIALLIILLLLLFWWRRKRKTRSSYQDEEKRCSTSLPEAIPCHRFVDYYANNKDGYTIFKQQFLDLGLQSKEMSTAVTFANLPENRRKNRYTNILPFDDTRVKLKIDEDDEISSDYVNASYIKGYSGKTEYIATQGPLESTTRDFWKMILQENVSVIAMVSQFVEQSKEKCCQYFPNNHETMSFGESLEVKCSTELHFGTYCIRTLQVRKDSEQRNVVHMQFLEWPDFGVPQGTDNMLQFCHQLRENCESEGGLIVVHCSAGVGRTGTLITLDILLQTISDHKDINIYKTVLDLRKQRTNMVQTEKQYIFIHTCIKDHLEMPAIQSNEEGQEQLYENMDVLRSSMKKNLIETEVESAF
jgi:protein-tyrosine phosphatase